MKKRLFVLMVFLGVSCVVLFAGPFGIDMKMSLEDLENAGFFPEVDEIRTVYTWYSVFPSKPHDLFEQYFVAVDDEYGVCKIVAVGKDIETSTYGENVIDAFERVEKGVSWTYGEVDVVFDYLDYESVWNEPEDWMYGLYYEERTLLAFWEPTLDDIDNIMLEANALSSTVGWLMLGYESLHWSDVLDRD
ncbi:hypothetical protein [Parasphaerochaeta coccoides]|uniref:Lipoprotein n=1 Tax=Parasphaerochaeta coccoides (strain ATCC BAA-1237 / DSM 17374 / SPN1) TaxID=760011 RepID=F4GLZ6_PARC1|nr:hypothetical protein [Parasphaerochaeta coccoides]AEC03037.1 hypothetical protein Spico_1839 [Parasphaerochaeta coccoides DSM 17374]